MQKAAAQTPLVRPLPSPDHVTPYDRLVWQDGQVERLLASGERREDLETYFGTSEYRELARLARRAERAPLARDVPRVVIVPGIMGSQLGLPRRQPLPRDVLWLDPLDISSGRLLALKVSESSAVCSYGVVLYSYLKLKLQLRAAGFECVFHAYDWRLGVEPLGKELARRLQAENAPTLAVVAHSMGALVSRAALSLGGGERVRRLVLLGAPNFGSFGAVQALRGTYAVVRKIARVDAYHSAEALAAEVFTSFPSLYQMLPAAGYSGALDLFDPSAWPAVGPQPQRELLRAARHGGAALAAPDERFTVVVGVGQETVTAVHRRRGDFIYTVTRHGDGTVPVACARLPGARHYYAAVAHSELTRDGRVASAVVELLRAGRTRRLAESWRTASRAQAQISDAALRRTHTEKVDWTALEPEQRRLFLQNLNEPPQLRLRIPGRAERL